jgi:hypothetical protein
VKGAALRNREKAMVALVGEAFDELCGNFGLDNRGLGLVLTCEGKNATVVCEPPVTVTDDTTIDRWDPITDNALGRAVFVVDDKTVPIASYRAMQQLHGVAPNAHKVTKGKHALDHAIEELSVVVKHEGLGGDQHDSPAVVTNVWSLLSALDKSQMQRIKMRVCVCVCVCVSVCVDV